MKSQEEKFQETKSWDAERFGISENEILGYNSGSCYDRIQVSTKEAADKVSEFVKGQTANGGMLDGMPLGGQSYIATNEHNKGVPYYDVYC